MVERRERPRFSVKSGCLFEVAGDSFGASLLEVSASGAFLESALLPPLGAHVVLSHETGGRIDGMVTRLASHGFAVTFDLGEPSVTFALRAIAGSMSTELAA